MTTATKTGNPLIAAFTERFPDYMRGRALDPKAVSECRQYAEVMGITVEDAFERNARAFLALRNEDALKIAKRATYKESGRYR